MNPITIASTFSIQKISKHHFLVRGDERVSDYMKFCDVKWSNTYKGWLVHEDDELDLIQMHMEVLDSVKNEREEVIEKKSNKKSSSKSKKTKKLEESPKNSKKKKTSKKLSDYEKIKRNIDVSDDEEEDEEYIPSSNYEDSNDSEYEPEDTEETESEYTDTEEETESEEETEDSDEEEEGPKKDQKKEYQFYKKGILAFGKMDKKEKNKLDPIWNKHLGGWIIHKSYQDKLEKMGWKEVSDQEEAKEQKINILVPRSKNSSKSGTPVTSPIASSVITPTVVTPTPTVYKERTYDFYKNILHVSGPLQDTEEISLDAIFNPALNGYMVTKNYLSKLVELGFTERNPVSETVKNEKELVKVDFSETKKLNLSNEKTIE